MAVSMETVLQDLERKSMGAEDLRGQLIYPHNWRNERVSTWRNEFNDMQKHVDRHVDTLNEIREAVVGFQNLREPGEDAGGGRMMANPYFVIHDVEQALRENGIVETDSEDEMDAAPDAPPDTRPLITPALHVENPTLWNELWNRNQGPTCAICNEPHSRESLLRDGPMNSDIPTRCTHWACTICWNRLAVRGATT